MEFRVQGSGSGFRNYGSEFRVQGSGSRVQGSGRDDANRTDGRDALVWTGPARFIQFALGGFWWSRPTPRVQKCTGVTILIPYSGTSLT